MRTLRHAGRPGITSERSQVRNLLRPPVKTGFPVIDFRMNVATCINESSRVVPLDLVECLAHGIEVGVCVDAQGDVEVGVLGDPLTDVRGVLSWSNKLTTVASTGTLSEPRQSEDGYHAQWRRAASGASPSKYTAAGVVMCLVKYG